ncbi:MAG: PAS domain S-box protein, partial [Syntrophorhabdales bacterium]
KMEEALRRSEELHRMLAENASDMIWTADPRSGRITYVSPSVFRLTGYTVQEAMEQLPEARLAPASLAIVKEHTRRTLESVSLGQRIENECLELETPCKDGSTISTETVVGGMYNASGDLVAMQGVSRDITERKRTEEALRTSQLQLAAAMDLARIVYWEADWETDTFIFNDPFYAFLATTADREGGYRMAASEYVQRFVHPDDWPIIQQSAERTRTGTDSDVLVNIEHRIVRRDGEIRHIVVRMRGFRDAEGRIVRAFGANQDITDRKRVETELARVNRALRMLGGSNQVLIDVADEATLLNDVCRIAVEVGGYRMACVGYAEQDEAKTIRPVAQAGFESGYLESVNVTWADCDRGRGPAGVAIRTGQPHIVHDVSGDPTFAPWREEAVRRGYQSVIAVPLTGEGRTFGILSIYADEVGAFDVEEVEILTELADDLAFGITALRTRAEHRRAEEEKVALESRLLQAQKMEAIGQLAGGVAHDFNNILTVITGFGTLIKMAADKHEPINGQYLDQILASSQKAANLTQSLLTFGRKQRINLAPHSIDDMIANTGKLLERLLTEDIELKITPAAQDLTVMADVTQIDQILINLAANARDAMPHGGLLSIRTEVAELNDEFIKTHGYGEQGTYALLSISDTGIGMDRSTKEHIFEPFFTTKEVGKGTGLGLATVYGIVKQHNGYVVVDSEPHRGTTFRIYLPLVDKKRSGETRQSEEVESGSETVLVVEDDEGVRKLTTEILRAHGYTTMEAADGEDVVKVFMENHDKIDLMILDVVMPKKNGKEAYEEIRKTHPNVKVIFTSGYTGEVILDKGIQGETVDFITKPLTPNGLLRKVREVLDR